MLNASSSAIHLVALAWGELGSFKAAWVAIPNSVRYVTALSFRGKSLTEGGRVGGLVGRKTGEAVIISPGSEPEKVPPEEEFGACFPLPLRARGTAILENGKKVVDRRKNYSSATKMVINRNFGFRSILHTNCKKFTLKYLRGDNDQKENETQECVKTGTRFWSFLTFTEGHIAFVIVDGREIVFVVLSILRVVPHAESIAILHMGLVFFGGRELVVRILFVSVNVLEIGRRVALVDFHLGWSFRLIYLFGLVSIELVPLSIEKNSINETAK